MIIKAFVIVATLATIGWALSPGVGQAKGPFEIVIFGGDLAGAVTIPPGEVERFFPDSDLRRQAPSSPPGVTYTVAIYSALEEGERFHVNTLAYYPAHDGEEALFRSADGWLGVDPGFEDALNRHIAEAPKVITAASSSTSGGGFPAEGWYAIGAAVAAVAVGGGIAARRLARPQPSG